MADQFQQPATCPFSSGKATQPSQAQPATCPVSGANVTQPQAPATCPLGYGAGGATPKLTDLHCVLCKLYLHDPVSTNCNHIFCRGCIVRFAECPICGADVQQLQADTVRHAQLERFLEHHTSRDAIAQLAASDPTLEGAVPAPGAHPGASLQLHLGLCSLAAGNLHAALARCGAAVAAIERQSDAHPAVQLQLGTAQGCMGDCYKRQGDLIDAAQCYEASIQCLQGAGDEDHAGDDEVLQALTVSWSKLGDVRYMQERLSDAHTCYATVLRLRESALNMAKAPTPGSRLDLAVSLAKLADVAQARGDAAAQASYVSRARDALAPAEAHLAEAQGAIRVKYAALLGALATLGG